MYNVFEYVFQKDEYFKATRFDGYNKYDSDWYIVKKDFYINGLALDKNINSPEDIVHYLVENNYIKLIENYTEFNLYDEEIN